MTDDERSSQKAREVSEAALVATRLIELRLNPIQGKFDAAHLQAVHAYIFQDLPHHQPGIIRSDTPDWTKTRVLEGRATGYEVSYAHDGIEARIITALDNFGGPTALKGLTREDAAQRLAGLYGELDHAHAFYEGNSRTLREFTRELASKAGLTLDWTPTAVSAAQRNALYVARDLAVLERTYPSKGMSISGRSLFWELQDWRAAAIVKRPPGEVGSRNCFGANRRASLPSR